MIKLNRVYTEKSSNIIYFKADCNLNGREEVLWYSTSIENEKYISLTNADAFILVLFIYSIFNNKKLKSEAPISARLKYGLLEVLLPTFQMMGYKSIKEDFDFALEDDSIFPEAKAVGTAMSFGVDSFHAYLDSQNTQYPVDTLTLFNAGAFGQYGGVEAERLFELMKSKVKDFAKKEGKEFLWVNTNLNEILKMKFVQTHTFRNFSCVLIFQKYFKKYYYASGLSINSFKLTDTDPAYYDVLNSKAIGGNSLEFFISGLLTNRMRKTILISNNRVTFSELNVCLITPDNQSIKINEKVHNCSSCFKCIRTMASLDVIGQLENYRHVFDLDIYKKNKNKYFGELLYMKYRNGNVFSREIFEEAKKNKYQFSTSIYYFAIVRAIKPIMKKIKNA